MASESSNPQDVVHGRAADRARLRPTSRGNDEAKFSASQPVEIAQSREGISEAAPRISPPRSYEEGSVVGLLGPVDEALEVSRSGARPTPFPGERGGEVGEVEGKFSASQSIEIARNRERISPTPAPFSLPVLTGRGWGWGSSRPWTRLWRSPEAERAPPPALPRERGREICGEIEGKFSASQPFEIARNRERISETSPSRIPSRFLRGRPGVGLFGPALEGFRGLRKRRAPPPQTPRRKRREGKRFRLLNTATQRNFRRARSARPSS